MVPIHEATDPAGRGYTFADFSHRLLEICQEHHEQNRALAFAFIIYDQRHAEISKVLKHPDNWRALNAISGQFLTVFAILIKDPRPRSRTNRDTIEFLVRVRDDDPGPKVNTVLKSHFNIDKPTVPAVLFFQATNEGVLDYYCVQLSTDSEEQTYRAIKATLTAATKAIAKVGPENRQNRQAIFNLIKGRLETDEELKLAKATVIVGVKLLNVIKLLDLIKHLL